MKKLQLLFCFVFFCLAASAGGGEYSITNIPAALLKNANVVKRMEQTTFEIVNTGEAILHKKYAITILNEAGDKHAGFMEYYDKLHEVRNIEGVLYDAYGKELKKLKNKQVMDISGVDDNSLIDDNRRKAHNFFYKVYPYTVQYEVDIKYNGTLFFPIWLPREDENFSVQQSSISILYPRDYKIRFKAFNYSGTPVAQIIKKGESLTWEIKDLPAIKSEYATPNWYEVNTVVFFGPTNFEIERYKGSMNSWKEFGKFVYELKKGRDQLPENIKQTVHKLTSNVNSSKEKIAILYEYMQKNTRYISVQLGIGGWQPFDATYVATKSYGDCKALTNYMYSLLKEAGIPACYTLVKAGRKAADIIEDFPSQQFNHVILSVPLQSDTMWLECTSQTLPAGYLSEFTSDRLALAIDESGGTLVRTPSYKLNANLELRNIKAIVEPDGLLNINVTTNYTGLQQDYYHSLINSLSKDKVKERLHEQLDFATYDITSFDYNERKSTLPEIKESLQILVSNYASVTGKRLFIVPNVMTRWSRKLEPNLERKNDLELGYAYTDKDTVEISLPPGYTPESMPKETSISNQFGKYNCSVKLENDKLYYYRLMEFNGGRFPAKDYTELVKFYDTIYKADRSKIVLVKNEEPKKGF